MTDILAVNHFNGAVVSGLGALEGKKVTYADTKAKEVLGLAFPIKDTIDVNLSGIILQVKVTILGICNLGNGTGNLILLGTVRLGIEFGNSNRENLVRRLVGVAGLANHKAGGAAGALY